MRVLAIEPYYEGSHRAFLEEWRARSRHDFSLQSLPGYKWKWRMRHASITIAQRIRAQLTQNAAWDLIWCSDMLNLPELLGLVPALGRLPTVIYFHENQLTYPNRHARERDHHFAYTNFISAVCADAVWFNSAFHRDDFLSAMRAFLSRMPDFQHLEQLDQILEKSEVQSPGVQIVASGPTVAHPSLRILWCARWEHDKAPEDFFAAVEQLKRQGLDFRLSVVGPSYQQIPPIFAQSRQTLKEHIDHWGFQTREAYRDILGSADVIVSTARHEFFGIGVLEAVSAGAYPLLPRRLAYPEVLGADDPRIDQAHFFDGTIADLVRRLTQLIERHQKGGVWGVTRDLIQARIARFDWNQRALELDDRLECIGRLTFADPGKEERYAKKRRPMSHE